MNAREREGKVCVLKWAHWSILEGTCPRVRADAQKRRKTLGPRSLESHECESNRFVRLSWCGTREDIVSSRPTHALRGKLLRRFRSRFIGPVCSPCRPFHTFVLIEWANCQHSFSRKSYGRRLSLRCIDRLDKISRFSPRIFSVNCLMLFTDLDDFYGSTWRFRFRFCLSFRIQAEQKFEYYFRYF